jgi:hypothetical protein
MAALISDGFDAAAVSPRLGVALASRLQLSSSMWPPSLGGGDLLAPHLCHARGERRAGAMEAAVTVAGE